MFQQLPRILPSIFFNLNIQTHTHMHIQHLWMKYDMTMTTFHLI